MPCHHHNRSFSICKMDCNEQLVHRAPEMKGPGSGRPEPALCRVASALPSLCCSLGSGAPEWPKRRTEGPELDRAGVLLWTCFPARVHLKARFPWVPHAHKQLFSAGGVNGKRLSWCLSCVTLGKQLPISVLFF
ncbi:hypothetical protein H1C71_037437 [Ictidomys tridecemlineatus]|nr:hypothetical protein H1C71_037437 [Ictidomys tridecemlineatus]